MRLSLIGMAFPVVRSCASSSAHFISVSASQGRQWNLASIRDLQSALEEETSTAKKGRRKRPGYKISDASKITAAGKRGVSRAVKKNPKLSESQKRRSDRKPKQVWRQS
jgi:hypothetical protein